jgi:hypothetical protein
MGNQSPRHGKLEYTIWETKVHEIKNQSRRHGEHRSKPPMLNKLQVGRGGRDCM